jgi:hypothetical protein
MPTPFFQCLQLPPIHVAFEDIVPTASTAARVRQRVVYTNLIQQWRRFLNNTCWIRSVVKKKSRYDDRSISR